jgi:signal transduction histidine kinase
VGLLRTLLLVVFPLLVVVLAAVAWRVIGATLRPVEALRRGAEEITGAGGTARLPLPVGRDEIHRLAATLNDMLDRLEAGRARQREFVGDAAHELRSPLTNMRTQLEVAQRLGPAADWPAVSDDLLTDTRRLGRLVDDLLLLARSDNSPRPTRTEPVDLAALVRDAAARRDRVHVTVANPVWTLGDPDELRRVLANLVENADRHARTQVCLSSTSEGAWSVLTVVDDGPGIPAADRARVFERFTRLDDARARSSSRSLSGSNSGSPSGSGPPSGSSPGSPSGSRSASGSSSGEDGGAGLGLAIVRELVRRHGGSVTLTDASGDSPPGLRVEVRVPASGAPM